MTVKLTDLTNELDAAPGDGVFDILIQTVELRLQEQYDEGRITGSDFATVYLGAIQSVLQQSVQFLLNKDKYALEQSVIQATLEKQWGYNVDVDADGDLSLGGNTGAGLIDQQVLEATEKVEVVTAQAAKVYADTALVKQQQTTEIANTEDATGGTMKAKQDLIAAQTLGFVSDTKQKVLKQMLEGYAVTLSIAGTATAPDCTKEPQIDALCGELLTDVGSAVTIP